MGELARTHRVTTHNYSHFNATLARYIEKLEQPDPRVAAAAFRDKAYGVGDVIKWLGIAGLLILLGLAVALWQYERKGTAAAVEAMERPVFPKVPDLDHGGQAAGRGENKAGKTIVDYTIFQTVEVSDGISVVTGWNYASNESSSPDHQYCHIRRRTAEAEDSIVHIKAIGQNSYEMPKAVFKQKLPDLSYESTMAKCRWLAG